MISGEASQPGGSEVDMAKEQPTKGAISYLPTLLPLTALPQESDFTLPSLTVLRGTLATGPGATGVLEDRSLPTRLGNSGLGFQIRP